MPGHSQAWIKEKVGREASDPHPATKIGLRKQQTAHCPARHRRFYKCYKEVATKIC